MNATPAIVVTGAAAAPPPASRADAIARARGLVPELRARARSVDVDRAVSSEMVDRMQAAGLFGVLTPKAFGGAELGLATLVDVTAEIASACGSSGWLYGVLAGHSWLLNLFPEQAQRDVYTSPRPLMATVFRLGGTVRRVEGGFRLTKGEGRFCSGIDHADWVIIGNQVINDDGTVEPRFFVIHRSDIAEIIDDWHVSGLRGTASKSIRVPDAFIPEHRSVTVADMSTGTTPGAKLHGSPLYRMHWRDVSPFSLVGVPMGIARATVETFAASLNRTMANFTGEQLAEQSATFARLGVAAADVDAVYSSIVESAQRIDAIRDPSDLTSLQRARLARDWAYAAQKSRLAVTSLFEAAGGTATYNDSDVQRLWRDVNSAAQHYAFTWDAAMSSFGRAAVGVAPTKFAPKGR